MIQVTFNISNTDERPSAALLAAQLQALHGSAHREVRVVDVIVLPEDGVNDEKA